MTDPTESAILLMITVALLIAGVCGFFGYIDAAISQRTWTPQGKPVETIEGGQVRVITLTEGLKEFPVVAVIDEFYGPYAYTTEGLHQDNSGTPRTSGNLRNVSDKEMG